MIRRAAAQLGVAVDAIQVFEGYFEPPDKAFLAFAQPDPGIIVFLIGFIGAFRVTELTLEITFILLVILLNAFPKCPLEIGIDVHFYGAIADGLPYLVLRAAAATMKNEIDGFGSGMQ